MAIVLKKRRIYGPDVGFVYRDGSALVEKTYRNRPLPVRVAGRLLIRWETYIYSKLKDIPGIPGVVPSPDPFTLTTMFMGGQDLKRKGTDTPDRAYFEQLEALIRAVHNRGVVHLDMRNRRNYGMDEDGRPYLVDFASGLYLPFQGPVQKMLCAIDWMGYLKVKARLNKGLLSHEEIRWHALGNGLSRLWFPSKIIPFFRGLFRRLFC